jgi:hypothetical protein
MDKTIIWYIHTMEYYLPIHATTSTNFENKPIVIGYFV